MYIKTYNLKNLKKTVSIMLILTVFVSVVVFAGNFLSEDVEVPVIMYHQVLKDEQMCGKYVISPGLFEEDVKYLINNGYTTIFIKDLTEFSYNNKKLPEKPVVLSFDDGHLTILHYILPILEKYNVKAVVSVVGDYLDKAENTEDKNINYSYLTWDDLNILKKSGLVEIGNHTYSYHNMNPRLGIGMLKGESEEDYKKLITDDLERMNKKIKDKTGEAPVTFTYPFGKVSSASLDVIKKIFKASLSCEEGITGIGQGDYDSLYLIKRYNRPFGTTSQEFFSKLKL